MNHDVLSQYDLYLYSPASQTPEHEQRRLVSAFERVTDPHWNKRSAHYEQLRATMFEDRARVAVAVHEDQVIGFSVMHRLLVDSKLVIYASNLQVLPAHESSGIRAMMNRCILHEEWKVGPLPVYIAFRTRNPRVWSLSASKCTRIVPSFGRHDEAPELVDLAVKVAREIFPARELELPSLVMRDAYTDFTYKNQPQHPDAELNRRFFERIQGERDVIFGLGEYSTDVMSQPVFGPRVHFTGQRDPVSSPLAPRTER